MDHCEGNQSYDLMEWLRLALKLTRYARPCIRRVLDHLKNQRLAKSQGPRRRATRIYPCGHRRLASPLRNRWPQHRS